MSQDKLLSLVFVYFFCLFVWEMYKDYLNVKEKWRKWLFLVHRDGWGRVSQNKKERNYNKSLEINNCKPLVLTVAYSYEISL